MHKRILVGAAVVAVAAGLGLALSPNAQFVIGGAMVNLGFRMQDHLEAFDLDHNHPDSKAVYDSVVQHNHLAAGVRQLFPRTPRHPLVAMVVCMDARIDTEELVGDTRKYYYVIRTAGSALADKELDMLELAVANGVETILLTRHTDCAAEKVAANPQLRGRYPHLVAAIDQRDAIDKALAARPSIAQKLRTGALTIGHMHIDTATDAMTEVATGK
ncbi:MAG: hypothetical protein FJ100_13910 [Deltaproteobacteria bacterium]|nr:hypothetical protein [Deltaproteobacteria bacterium]